ncbi:hypothetical protein [Allopontixanthobacter sediminis]|uniref:Uncharacterized protein n=1 Tax=Allopontixanthobacter sediminis TaxID=1689985 RepID=A0A845AW73_9SPHN|nr:hypothetical protein [Allopontixanthobacter sediminis]MXP43271.1 hypothetical protein [Allopontixanthobacter sediminis]
MARLENCALARAIEGQERPLVSRGEIIATWRQHNEALVMFLPRQRRSARYPAGLRDGGNLKPGNTMYETLKKEILAEAYGEFAANEDEIIASINAKLDLMIARKIAAGQFFD